MNLVPNYSPIGSIYDGDDYGYSDSFNSVSISSSANRDDITNFKLDKEKLLVFITARFSYQEYELKHIQYLVSRGQPVLIIGKGSFINEFFFEGVVSSGFVAERIIDYSNKYQDIFNVNVTYNGEEYISANPYYIYGSGTNQSIINTVDSAYDVFCYEDDDFCQYSRSIAIKQNSVIILADDLMLRNNNVRNFPQNLNLLDALIRDNFPNVKEVILDETHLNWMAISSDGLRIKINEIAYSWTVLIIIVSISVLLPLIFGMRSGIFRSSAEKEKGILSKRIMKRFEIIHTENMISVPLSKEEKILTNEMVAKKVYGIAYFSYVANDIVEYIDTHNLKEYIAQDIYNDILALKDSYIPAHIGWKMIENANYAIKYAEMERDRNFERRK